MKKNYKLIVFLGNPGKKYEKTRHNLAWRLAGLLTEKHGLSWQKKFNGLWCRDAGLVFLKPETLMNLSGNSVRKAMDFFKFTPDEVLVAHDELELAWGELNSRVGGGLAGHKGLKSVKQQLGTTDFGRLRLGIGRPPYGDVSRWVLSPFAPSEEAEMDDFLGKALAELEK